MKGRWVILLLAIAVIAVGASIYVFLKLQAIDKRKIEQRARRDNESVQRQRIIDDHRNACQSAIADAISPRIVLDFPYTSFPLHETSTGYKYIQVADFGNSLLEYTCYFDTNLNVIKLTQADKY